MQIGLSELRLRHPFVRTLLITLIALHSAVMVKAQKVSQWPSRKAALLMPQVEKLSSSDSPKKVLEIIDKILGQAEMGAADHIGQSRWDARLYVLDDGTGID